MKSRRDEINSPFLATFLLATLFIWLSFACPAYASGGPAEVGDPLYFAGMDKFDSKNYKQSCAIFKQCVAQHPWDPAAMYMYALSLQKLGQYGAAINMYKAVMNQFPDSAPSIRSQSAMAMLDPGYLKTWRVTQAKTIKIPRDTGPDLVGTNLPLPPRDAWPFRRLNNDMVVHGSLNRAGCLMVIDQKSDLSYIGVNQLKELGFPAQAVNEDANPIYRCDIQVGGIHRIEFPIHVQNQRSSPPLLGQDFLHNYKLVVNDKVGKIFLAQISTAPLLTSKLVTINNQTYDTFEVPYRLDQGLVIVDVTVDRTRRPMILVPTSDITSFGAEQIDSSYYQDSELKVTAEGENQLERTRQIQIQYMALGKIEKRLVPAMVIDYAYPRFQANEYNFSPYPKLGRQFYAGWKLQEVDEKRRVVRFISETPEKSHS